jgi:hypothetical protein
MQNRNAETQSENKISPVKGQCKTQCENAVRKRTLKNTQKVQNLSFLIMPQCLHSFPQKMHQSFLFLPKKAPNLPIST